MNTRRVRATVIVLAGLLAIGVVAWRTGASAVHYASDPSHEPCPALSPGDHVLSFATPAGVRRVRLHVPRGAYKPRALVLALHGAGQTGEDMARDTGFSRLADREHFLVAYPSAAGPHAFWNMSGQVAGAPNDVEALERSLDQLERAACIDDARVFVTGVSNGGGMAARLGCELSERLAGIAAVAGGYRALPPCRPERPLPVLEIHGTGDQVVPYGGRPPDYRGSVARWLAQWRRIDGCRGRARRIVPATGVTEIAWRDCAEGTRVEHVRLDGAAHGWPGGPSTKPPPAPFAATWRTWEFFRSLPPRAPVA
ncbi:MAG TPA: PHB depolymerase family esterase [Solirubrobacteraceae bacterium]